MVIYPLSDDRIKSLFEFLHSINRAGFINVFQASFHVNITAPLNILLYIITINTIFFFSFIINFYWPFTWLRYILYTVYEVKYFWLNYYISIASTKVNTSNNFLSYKIYSLIFLLYVWNYLFFYSSFGVEKLNRQ